MRTPPQQRNYKLAPPAAPTRTSLSKPTLPSSTKAFTPLTPSIQVLGTCTYTPETQTSPKDTETSLHISLSEHIPETQLILTGSQIKDIQRRAGALSPTQLPDHYGVTPKPSSSTFLEPIAGTPLHLEDSFDYSIDLSLFTSSNQASGTPESQQIIPSLASPETSLKPITQAYQYNTRSFSSLKQNNFASFENKLPSPSLAMHPDLTESLTTI